MGEYAKIIEKKPKYPVAFVRLIADVTSGGRLFVEPDVSLPDDLFKRKSKPHAKLG